MTITTHTLNKLQSEKRKGYGEQQFLKFQEVIQTLNLEKNEYWKNSNFNFLNKIEKKQAPALLVPEKKTANKNSKQIEITEKISELMAGGAHNIDPEVKNKLSVLVFVNGLLTLEHSRLISKEIVIETAPTAIHKLYPQALDTLEKDNHHEENLMMQLNTSLASVKEGLTGEQLETFIRISKNASITEPLLLIFLDDPHAKGKILTPRIHLHLEANAALTLMEVHAPEYALLQNTFLNLTLAEGSKVTHIQELKEGDNVNHTHLAHGTFERNSTYHSFVLQQGSQSAILEKDFSLIGEGAQVHLKGLVLGTKRQHFNHIISLQHDKARTSSQQDYKFLLNGHARGGFTGNVCVARDAQEITSEQLCKTILIGEKAVMYTRPQLEIFADDVKCGHGATIGQIDPEEVFYLTSRGISETQALSILSYAFVRDFFVALTESLSPASQVYGELLAERNLPKTFA